MLAWESGCTVTSPSVLRKGKACSSGSCTGELWVNKACGARWVLSSPLRSAKIKPPATVGWQQQAGKPQPQTAIHRTVSPYLWWENNRTTPACWKTYWNRIAFELGTLCGFFLVLFCAVLFYFIFPLWRDNYRTTSEAPSPGLEAEGRTPKLLRLKLHCIWTWRIFLIYIYFFLFSFT
jgi:hypothetical protein